MKDQKIIARQILQKLKLRKGNSEVYKRQTERIAEYKKNGDLALIVDAATAVGKNLAAPFRSEIIINPELKVPFTVGVHRAVGGDHDHPNPGDILCASLASCFDSTLRLIANRLEIELLRLLVKVTAKIDVRGTLLVDRSVPVGFQSMHVDIEIGARDTSDKMIHTLIGATKRSCVIYQTLKNALPITKEVKIVKEN